MSNIIAVLVGLVFWIWVLVAAWPVSLYAGFVAFAYGVVEGRESVLARSARATLQPLLWGTLCVVALQLSVALVDYFRSPEAVGWIEARLINLKKLLESVSTPWVVMLSMTGVWLLQRRLHMDSLVGQALKVSRIAAKALAVVTVASSFTFFAGKATEDYAALSARRHLEARYAADRRELIAAEQRTIALRAIESLVRARDERQVTYLKYLVQAIDRVADGSELAARSVGRWTAESAGPPPVHDPPTFRVRDIRDSQSEQLYRHVSDHSEAVSRVRSGADEGREVIEALLEEVFSAPRAAAKGRLKAFVSNALLGFVDADLGLIDASLGDWTSELLIDGQAKRVTDRLARLLADRLQERIIAPPSTSPNLLTANLRDLADARVNKSLLSGTSQFADTVEQLKSLSATADEARLAAFNRVRGLELSDRHAIAALTHADVVELRDVKRAAQALKFLSEADVLVKPGAAKAAARAAATLLKVVL